MTLDRPETEQEWLPETPQASPASAASAAQAPPAEEKQELKVAVNSKAAEPAPAIQGSGVGLLSQLGDKGAKREAELRLAEEATQASAAAAPGAPAVSSSSASSEASGDEVEWTRLFLAKSDSANSFRKFKLCVVQREDTLDAIASRYNVQTRELQLHNRLTEPHVSEGQVLYIP
ncbi:LysM peptidoglycan-binding domain-containing protein [Cohnella fermenti]|uniref:LysM peptidoglycan-binding domain-containing protein n=1 Tax=Cohnella fermenti TaxID=2565925 RepID=A0A4V3WGE0_9BACL|nr:LysM peptidoglycan-binding domain-containing protein [Cohnella fermenti]